MKHVKTFESFLYESTAGEGYLQISLHVLGLVGDHGISCAVTSQDEHMGELGAGASSELETPKVKQLLKDLQLWKSGDKTGKIDVEFLNLVDKNMLSMGFRLGSYRSRLKPPYVMVVKDEAQTEKAIKDVIAMLDKTYDSYTPALIPNQGRPVNVKGPIDRLVNEFEGGRSDLVRDMTALVTATVGATTPLYLDDYYDRDEALIKLNDEYTKNGKVSKEEDFESLKVTIYSDGVAIIRIGNTDKRLPYGLKTGAPLFAAKKA